MGKLKLNTLYKYAYYATGGSDEEVIFYKTVDYVDFPFNVYVRCKILHNLTSHNFSEYIDVAVDSCWAVDSVQVSEEYMEFYRIVYG